MCNEYIRDVLLPTIVSKHFLLPEVMDLSFKPLIIKLYSTSIPINLNSVKFAIKY